MEALDVMVVSLILAAICLAVLVTWPAVGPAGPVVVEAAPAVEAPEPPPDGPRGIGGWLLIPAAVLIIKALASGAGVALIAFDDAPDPARDWLQIATEVFLLAFCLVTAVAFFRKTTAAPSLYVALLWAAPLLLGLDLALRDHARDELGLRIAMIAQAAVPAVIWTTYFQRSLRVRNTFVR